MRTCKGQTGLPQKKLAIQALLLDFLATPLPEIFNA